MDDLMTTAARPRYSKLDLAGKQNNWPCAGYEPNALRNAFARIARTIPKHQTVHS
jgi:hypothetical protein